MMQTRIVCILSKSIKIGINKEKPMKIIVKVILIALISQFTLGCSKEEPAENSSTETVTISENTKKIDGTAVPAEEATVVEPQQPQSEAPTPAEPVGQQSEKLIATPLKGLEWVKGSPVAFESGNVYIIEFWATWCGPCKVSIPHLTKIQKKYKDKGVTIIGISTEAPETVKPFVKKMGDQMDYTVAVDVNGFAQKNYMRAFNVNGIPHAFIVNSNGKIAWNGHPLDGMETILDLVVVGNFDPAAYAKKKAEAEALQQKIMGLYMDYFKKTEASGVTEETKQLASDFIEKAPVEGLNAFAWTILTQVQEADRDIEAALKAALKANELTGGNEPSVLDTYALALFTNGKINDAIEVQQKAVDSASDYPDAQKQLQQTLEKYKAELGKQI